MYGMENASIFHPTCFDDLIGHKKTLQEWKQIVLQLQPGDILFVYGYSGVGKTMGTKKLLEEFQYTPLFLDSQICSDGKEVMDRIQKFHRWMDLGASLQEDTHAKKKVIVLDEIESFLKLDRNVLNHIVAYRKQYGTQSIPVILLGHVDVSKKLGDMKHHITHSVRLHRLQDIDIFLFLKKRLPKNKIKLTDLMKLAEDSRGNMYAAILTIQQYTTKKKQSSVLIHHYIGDEQKTFPELFECKNPHMVDRLLMEDSWMHPLKVHENILKLLSPQNYVFFLKNYLDYEFWNYQVQDTVLSEVSNPIFFLTHVILMVLHFQGTIEKLDSMDFSKLLSYISTQKKYRKWAYEKVPPLYPLEDVGMYWVQSIKESGKREKDKDDENFL